MNIGHYSTFYTKQRMNTNSDTDNKIMSAHNNKVNKEMFNIDRKNFSKLDESCYRGGRVKYTIDINKAVSF